MTALCSLDTWQAELASSFDDVTLAKLDLPHEPVTFALEHGLSKQERDELGNVIRQALKRGEVNLKHYLCWVVYAAELGYLYAGDQYWSTFEESTPQWKRSHRPFIKSCFRKFCRQYHGAVPKGPWARHFSTICWPITHAILPTDLQRPLAEILFRLRHTIVAEDVETPSQLGRMIGRASHDSIARFRQFASEPDLIGQIAAALLLDEQPLHLIERKTLTRITSDLNREQQSRSWLHNAKTHLSRRATLGGLTQKKKTTRKGAATRLPEPALRPSLTLRAWQEGSWRLIVDIPNLTPFSRMYPALNDVFTKAVFRVGQQTRPRSIRALLHSTLSVPVSSWPRPGDPLLAFKPSHPHLDVLLRHHCTMDAGPWLFRIGADGTAKEIRTRRVSIGGNYIIVTQGTTSPLGSAVPVHCDGITAWQFTARQRDDLDEKLAALGFRLARKIQVEPTGLVPAYWDGEGAAGWLSTDKPVISISANYSIDRYVVQLDTGAQELQIGIEPKDPTDVVYLALPRLSAGVYHLRITAQPKDPSYRTELGSLEMRIRDPAPEGSQAQTRTAMIVIVEPADGSLDDLFNNDVKIDVLGPPSRECDVQVSLLQRQDRRPLYRTKLSKLPLPVSAHSWSSRLRTLLKSKTDFASAFAEADACELVFQGQDLGVSRHRFERPFSPLRWALTPHRDFYTLKLIEDVEDPEEIMLTRYEFSTPSRPRTFGPKERIRAESSAAKPGLYVAQCGNLRAATIVPMQTIESLQRSRPRFTRPPRTITSVYDFLDAIEAWSEAKSTGNIFGHYAWRQALASLIQQVCGVIAGTPWYKAELQFQRDQKHQGLAAKIPYKVKGATWPGQLLQATAQEDPTIGDLIKTLRSVTGQTDDCCEFTLRFASHPFKLREIYGDRFRFFCDRIMRQSELLRASRFLVLSVCPVHDDTVLAEDAPYPGWIWN